MTKQQALQAIEAQIASCQVCPTLCRQATNPVPGEGNPDADLLFIGEAPGSKEDATGKPFVGAAGKFLDEMLGSIGIAREQVFITNVVKYRPPNNRDPIPGEIKQCWPWLEAQIEIIQPKLIITLGRHAMNLFLSGYSISQIHGQPKRKGGCVYLPLYHPAAALYNGSMRQTLMHDFALIPDILKKLSN